MDCWDRDETEIELKLCCPPLKRKRRDSCSLDLFSGSSCETVAGTTENLGNRNNSISVSANSAGELKEQNLIRCLMKSYSSSKDSSSVSFISGVDCTLSLGMPHNGLPPEEQNPLDMLKQRTMQGSFNFIEIMPSKLLSPQIKNSDLEASYNIAAPFGGLYNISSPSSYTNNIHRSQLYKSHWGATANAATTSYPIAWFPIAHSGSKFMHSKDLLTHRNHARDLGPKKTSDRNPMNNSNGSSIRILQQNQRSNITSHGQARRCSTCNTTTTPLWRNGPKGPKSLCNACGIRYKKEERRVASAMAAAAENNNRFVNHNNKVATS